MSERIERYNGWRNRATWCVHLWLSNEEGDYKYWREQGREWLRESGIDDTDEEVREQARCDALRMLTAQLERELRGQADEALPQGASLWSDLVGDPLREVDWEEVAGAFLDE